ncbi:hypothetical protein PENSPDRAFT_643315 [Peniophora sp. CONT]|nr:hypothetical protein PENSPDRAFT_643315 [Peniophora sp. CONT]
MHALSSDGRYSHARAILGPELHDKLPTLKVLLVGAGGIGCELLKNIVLAGFGNITLLDLDTIDLSNLNRQFLFRKKDVKQSKAQVAARTAAAFNPHVNIIPVHGNIKDPHYDLAWFMNFDIVLNALDNLDARRHVNKMCMAGNIPLVESGTAGYLGQVQPIIKDRTECFDCIEKPTPRTFPVCTIRSTPSQPIHCIVWGKSYLLPQLFGEDENSDSTDDLDDALKAGENAQEIDALKREAMAFKAVRAALRSADRASEAPKLVFEKVFNTDIRNLLSMEDMWKHRAKPTPLDFDAIRDDRFELRGEIASRIALAINGATSANAKGTSGATHTNGASTSASAKLKDQRALSLRDSWEMFVASTQKLAVRVQAGEETISFDKDDDDTLDFVTAAANLRSAAYGIPGKSRWEVKEMAGNIIPAIATTNAIVSGLIVLQALQVLRKSYDTLKDVHILFKPTKPLTPGVKSPPVKTCGVCRDAYALLRCDPARVTLGQVVEAFVAGIRWGTASDGDGDVSMEAPEVSTYEAQRLLSDPDFDDNLGRTLESLGVTRGKFLTIQDEDGVYQPVSLGISILLSDHPADAPPMLLPSIMPSPAKRPAKPAPPPPASPAALGKRSAPDDDDIEAAQPAKKVARGSGLPNGPPTPSKRRMLEEDGLVLLEQGEKVDDDDDVIVLD